MSEHTVAQAEWEMHERIKFGYQRCGKWDRHMLEGRERYETTIAQAGDETWYSDNRGKEESGQGGEDRDEELGPHWGELLSRGG